MAVTVTVLPRGELDAPALGRLALPAWVVFRPQWASCFAAVYVSFDRNTALGTFILLENGSRGSERVG